RLGLSGQPRGHVSLLPDQEPGNAHHDSFKPFAPVGGDMAPNLLNVDPGADLARGEHILSDAIHALLRSPAHYPQTQTGSLLDAVSDAVHPPTCACANCGGIPAPSSESDGAREFPSPHNRPTVAPALSQEHDTFASRDTSEYAGKPGNSSNSTTT